MSLAYALRRASRAAWKRQKSAFQMRRHVEVDACAEDLIAVLILWRDLFQDERRIVEHSQLEIAARSKDMPLPIGFQGIGAS